MGRVVTPAVIESIEDLYRVQRGELAAEQVRRIELPEALVDTGATGLSLPRQLVQQLGLLPLRTRRAVTTTGVRDVPTRDVPTFGAVRLTVQGRDCVCDVSEVDDACPVLIGQVPLELMDFVVDPALRQLVGNPAHGGEHMMELL
jgi:predicted aspartyl protease